jgi:hypothetical protein
MIAKFRVQVPMGLDMALGYNVAVPFTELEYEDGTLTTKNGEELPKTHYNVFKFKVEDDGTTALPKQS